MNGAELRVSGLRLALGQDTTIAVDSLHLPAGRLFVLSGPSGSGKSTLLYLLSGLMRADAGSIDWNGTDLVALREARRDAWRRRNAGFIFQDFHLFEEMSPLDNVVAPAWFSGFSSARLRPSGQARLDAMGIPRERQRTSLLSRGEKQRVAIARAVVSEPRVIFADEPTASLDAASGAQVIKILAELARVEGRTVIAATHDAALRDQADMVLTLDHGQTVAA